MKILFYISKQYSIPIIDPLVLEAKRTGVETAFYLSDKVKKLFPEHWDVGRILSSVKESRIYDPDFVLCPGNFIDFRIPGIKVQLFHGLGIEKSSHFKIRHFFDVYLTSGPYVTRKFRKLQDKYGYFLIRETGWSKIDHILNYPKKDLRKKYNIPEDKKVILYAPTFSSRMESASEILDDLIGVVKENEFLLIKFHELMKNNIREYAGNKENIREIMDLDITPYLHIADVMISDTSSVIYEFLALKKPVVTYKTIALEDKGINIRNISELRSSLDVCLNEPGSVLKKSIMIMDQVNPYLNGDISSRIFKELKQIKIDGLPANKRKPLNLFRKMQIVYHGIFRKGYLR